ncbi:hypothetical protein EV360DRAFT_90549 [Lentinula raphanica]|nr:hypothetical protein EV360DRAFT_90549 [Lentinula raphanica]
MHLSEPKEALKFAYKVAPSASKCILSSLFTVSQFRASLHAHIDNDNMESKSKRKFSDLLKQAVPVGLREVPPEQEPETKRLRTTSPELLSTGQTGFVVDQGPDDHITPNDAPSSQHAAVAVESVPVVVSASSHVEGFASTTVPLYESSTTSELPSESTVSPDHLSVGQYESSLLPSIVAEEDRDKGPDSLDVRSTVPLYGSSATSEPPSKSTVSPNHLSESSFLPSIVAEEDKDKGPDSLDVPNQNGKRVLSESESDETSNKESETMQAVKPDEKGKASTKKARVSGWDHIRTFVRPTFVQKQRMPLPEASSSKPRLFHGPYPFPFIYQSPLLSTAQTLHATSASPSNMSILEEPTHAPNFFYASDADDDIHEAENIDNASSSSFRHRHHSGLSHQEKHSRPRQL